MALSTRSQFYYGHTITLNNNAIDFDEGGSEIQATLNSGDYSLTEFLVEIKRAMEAVGALTYTVSLNRTTRKITISSTSNFTLRTQTGTRIGTTAYSLIGYTLTSNKTGASTYTAENESGSRFRPQAIIDEHIASDDFVEKTDAVVNESASGIVQVVLFGTTRYVQMNIRLQTNSTQNNCQPQIENDASGVQNLRAFMDYVISKAKIEYMPDRDQASTFQTLILESTESNRKGTGYKLQELKGVPGYYETGKLVWRVVET